MTILNGLIPPAYPRRVSKGAGARPADGGPAPDQDAVGVDNGTQGVIASCSVKGSGDGFDVSGEAKLAGSGSMNGTIDISGHFTKAGGQDISA